MILMMIAGRQEQLEGKLEQGCGRPVELLLLVLARQSGERNKQAFSIELMRGNDAHRSGASDLQAD